MKKFSTSLALLSVLTGFSGSASADGWTGQVSVTNLMVSGQNADGSRIYVAVSPPLATACTASTASTQLRLDGSSQRGKYQMTLLAMAAAQGKKITVNLTGCDDWGYPVIYELQLAL